MPPDDPVLTRAYAPRDLIPQMAATGVERTVLVQAAPSVHETEYLLGIADATESVAAVVGWIDFERTEDHAHLERLADHPKLVGVRPMIQDIPDADWMLRDDVQWAFRALCDLDLTFDALGFPPHLSNFLTIFSRFPEMRVVVDHAMKPEIRDHDPERFRVWSDGMAAIAQETGAFCKLSGLVTEAGETWTIDDLRPYVDHVLDVFGAERVMWGSDWPVCRLRCEYEIWHGTAVDLTRHLDEDQCAAIFGGTAARFYRLPD